MCGIAGALYEEIAGITNIEQMTNKLAHRGPDATQFLQDNLIKLGHTRLAIIDVENGKQPMQKNHGGKCYTIVYNGELYNTEELRQQLLNANFSFTTSSDTEVLLASYIYWGEECLARLDGIFAFAIYEHNEEKLFLARDRFGVKPLFYRFVDGVFLFASEIKAILSHPLCEATVNRANLAALLAIGPSRMPGKTVYSQIEELEPGHCMVVVNKQLVKKRYYEINEIEHTDSVEDTIEKVKYFVKNAIKRQLVSDVPLCTFLSGGIDSSIISKIASDEMSLHTFSLSFPEHAKYFQKNDFQVSDDAFFIEEMVKHIGSIHHSIEIQEEQLFSSLTKALYAKDYPSMADIDSSLYLFCEVVASQFKVALSGECADELFGGYPWFQKPAKLFPWIQSINERSQLLKPNIREQLKLNETMEQLYEEAIKPVSHLSEHGQFLYLNQQYFMQTLLERKDRMSMANGLEVRVPFADPTLVEYVFNIPHEMKRLNGMEKGILRYAFEDELPESVVWRKKNPFPKTHNPFYTKLVQQELSKRFNKKDSILRELFEHEAFQQLIESGGVTFKKPWFGQLMTGPQLLAYFIQLDEWFEHYNINLQL